MTLATTTEARLLSQFREMRDALEAIERWQIDLQPMASTVDRAIKLALTVDAMQILAAKALRGRGYEKAWSAPEDGDYSDDGQAGAWAGE